MSIVCIEDSLTFVYGLKKTDIWVSVLSVRIKMNSFSINKIVCYNICCK
ncbi:hypothetical protein [Clostridium brassicae]|uniref:Uncharacterized protein n=1 Tax=Clostridium brassicae TaxID=2999072 RepID=A0ABT4DCC2_9CLOT|nr:hypothetical protein [Clostridium brassicae]MCY6959942.1 hypothetical protein [Clostridium brassicae]